MKTITYLHGKTREAFTAFPRQGVIYGVVVRQSNTSTSSLYVPVSTYTEQDKSGKSTVDWNSLQVIGFFLLLFVFPQLAEETAGRICRLDRKSKI